METNETVADGATELSEISIDLRETVDRTDATRATVSIPHERAQTVRATVRPSESGRWRCEFRVDPGTAAVSGAPGEEQVVHLGELSEWVAPVLEIIETLVTEAGC